MMSPSFLQSHVRTKAIPSFFPQSRCEPLPTFFELLSSSLPSCSIQPETYRLEVPFAIESLHPLNQGQYLVVAAPEEPAEAGVRTAGEQSKNLQLLDDTKRIESQTLILKHLLFRLTTCLPGRIEIRHSLDCSFHDILVAFFPPSLQNSSPGSPARASSMLYMLRKDSESDPLPTTLAPIAQTGGADIQHIVSLARDGGLSDFGLRMALEEEISSPNTLMVTKDSYAMVVMGFPELEFSPNEVYSWPKSAHAQKAADNVATNTLYAARREGRTGPHNKTNKATADLRSVEHLLNSGVSERILV